MKQGGGTRAWWLVVAALTIASAGCRGEDSEGGGGELPAIIRTRFTTEMKSILRDIRLAEDIARVETGSYVDWAKLRGSFLSRSIPDTYEVRLIDLTSASYRAEVTHARTGLTCQLTAGSGSASAVCD